MKNIHGQWIDDPDAVTFVDAHHHIWDLDRNYYPWLSDQPEDHFFLGDYSQIKRNYLPADYRRDTRRHNVLMTVHCEAEWDREDQVGETRWVSEMSRLHGFPNAIVAHAWFHTENAPDVLAAQASFPLVRGIRSKPRTTLTPSDSVRGEAGTMQDPDWLEGFSRLERHGLSWDLRVPFWHLEEAAEVARSFPRTPIVLNHTGFPWDRSPEGLAAWRAAMEIIARQPNVWLKVSEFGLRDRPWSAEDNAAIIHDAIAIFGIERCMFATNYPVSRLRVGFDHYVRSVRDALDRYARHEREAFFWRNAVALYRLPSPETAAAAGSGGGTSGSCDRDAAPG